MTVAELCDLLVGVPSSAEVVVEDVVGNCLSIQSGDYVKPLVYLSVQQEFPEDFYENNMERTYYASL